jgi:pentatricopeptide repeat protein
MPWSLPHGSPFIEDWPDPRSLQQFRKLICKPLSSLSDFEQAWALYVNKILPHGPLRKKLQPADIQNLVSAMKSSAYELLAPSYKSKRFHMTKPGTFTATMLTNERARQLMKDALELGIQLSAKSLQNVVELMIFTEVEDVEALLHQIHQSSTKPPTLESYLEIVTIIYCSVSKTFGARRDSDGLVALFQSFQRSISHITEVQQIPFSPVNHKQSRLQNIADWKSFCQTLISTLPQNVKTDRFRRLEDWYSEYAKEECEPNAKSHVRFMREVYEFLVLHLLICGGVAEAILIAEFAVSRYPEIAESQSFQYIVTYLATQEWFTGKLRDLLAQISKLRSGDDIHSESTFTPVQLEGRAADYITMRLCAQKKPDVAADLMGIGSAQPGSVKPTTTCYNVLIKAYIDARRIEEAVQTFHSLLRNTSLRPQTVTFNTILKCLADEGELEKAVDIYHLMESVGVKADSWTYAALLQASFKADKPDQVFHWYHQLLNDENAEVDHVIYGILVDGYGKSVSINSAQKSFDSYLRSSSPNEKSTLVLCTSLMCGYLRARDNDSVASVAKFMSLPDESGIEKWDLTAFNFVLRYYILAGKLNEVHELLNSMTTAGFQPDLYTATALVSGFVQSGNIDSGEKIAAHLLDHGSCLSPHAYTSLINAYGRKKQGNKIIEWFERAVKEPIVSLSIYPPQSGNVSLLNGFEKDSKNDGHQDKNENEKDKSEVADLHLYTATVKSLLRVGMLRQADLVARHLIYRWGHTNMEGTVNERRMRLRLIGQTVKSVSAALNKADENSCLLGESLEDVWKRDLELRIPQ